MPDKLPQTLRIATRKSPLALAQARQVAAALEKKTGCRTQLVPIVTTGDKQLGWSLEKQGGKGLFTAEIETALINGEADIAVHSAKDLPGEMDGQVAVAGYLPREDPRDVLVIRSEIETPQTLATSSARRRLQTAPLFPGAKFSEIRGNIETRLRKIADEHIADGTLLAAAGLKRLGILSHPGLEFRPLPFSQCVPAVAQAAIAIQCRSDKLPSFEKFFDAATQAAVNLERAFQTALGAGCHTAFAAHADGGTLHFFHEQTGIRQFPLGESDYRQVAVCAERILRELRLPRIS